MPGLGTYSNITENLFNLLQLYNVHAIMISLSNGRCIETKELGRLGDGYRIEEAGKITYIPLSSIVSIEVVLK